MFLTSFMILLFAQPANDGILPDRVVCSASGKHCVFLTPLAEHRTRLRWSHTRAPETQLLPFDIDAALITDEGRLVASSSRMFAAESGEEKPFLELFCLNQGGRTEWSFLIPQTANPGSFSPPHPWTPEVGEMMLFGDVLFLITGRVWRALCASDGTEIWADVADINYESDRSCYLNELWRVHDTDHVASEWVCSREGSHRRWRRFLVTDVRDGCIDWMGEFPFLNDRTLVTWPDGGAFLYRQRGERAIAYGLQINDVGDWTVVEQPLGSLGLKLPQFFQE